MTLPEQVRLKNKNRRGRSAVHLVLPTTIGLTPGEPTKTKSKNKRDDEP